MSEPVEAKPAWILGWEAGASSVAAILTDLIADLRAHCQEPSCGCDIGKAADAAESRLRLVRDE